MADTCNYTGLILAQPLRRRYFVTTSFIGWAESYNQPVDMAQLSFVFAQSHFHKCSLMVTSDTFSSFNKIGRMDWLSGLSCHALSVTPLGGEVSYYCICMLPDNFGNHFWKYLVILIASIMDCEVDLYCMTPSSIALYYSMVAGCSHLLHNSFEIHTLRALLDIIHLCVHKIKWYFNN